MKSLQSIARSHYQKYILISLIIFLVSIHSAFSSNNDTTSIVILGTVHNRTEKFTDDSLLNIIKRVNPDLILMELDSSFFTQSMSIKPEFQKISLENTVLTEYLKSYKVLVRPYDIEGRNKIYNDNNYFKQQKELSKALNKAKQEDLMQGEARILLDAVKRFDNITDAFATDYPNVINSSACSVTMDSKQYYANEGLIKIVTSVPILNQFVKFATFKRDFWIKRNNTMVTKILFWKKLLQPKTILVICGFEHKYYLSNSLKNLSEKNYYKIKEYWTF
jgi:hypothetical protein